MIDRGEEVSAVELAINSLEYACLNHSKYLDRFLPFVLPFWYNEKKTLHQFLIVVVCGGSLLPK